jgi:hypothetical protein
MDVSLGLPRSLRGDIGFFLIPAYERRPRLQQFFFRNLVSGYSLRPCAAGVLLDRFLGEIDAFASEAPTSDYLAPRRDATQVVWGIRSVQGELAICLRGKP